MNEITYGRVNEAIKLKKLDATKINDGFHTFGELYQHRIVLFIALCKELINNPEYQAGQKSEVWRTIKYSNNTNLEEGWFLMGIGKEQGAQITYHLPMSYWSKTDFAQLIDKAPLFDKHTSNDVVKRILDL